MTTPIESSSQYEQRLSSACALFSGTAPFEALKRPLTTPDWTTAVAADLDKLAETRLADFLGMFDAEERPRAWKALLKAVGRDDVMAANLCRSARFADEALQKLAARAASSLKTRGSEFALFMAGLRHETPVPDSALKANQSLAFHLAAAHALHSSDPSTIEFCRALSCVASPLLKDAKRTMRDFIAVLDARCEAGVRPAFRRVRIEAGLLVGSRKTLDFLVRPDYADRLFSDAGEKDFAQRLDAINSNKQRQNLMNGIALLRSCRFTEAEGAIEEAFGPLFPAPLGTKRDRRTFARAFLGSSDLMTALIGAPRFRALNPTDKLSVQAAAFFERMQPDPLPAWTTSREAPMDEWLSRHPEFVRELTGQAWFNLHRRLPELMETLSVRMRGPASRVLPTSKAWDALSWRQLLEVDASNAVWAMRGLPQVRAELEGASAKRISHIFDTFLKCGSFSRIRNLLEMLPGDIADPLKLKLLKIRSAHPWILRTVSEHDPVWLKLPANAVLARPEVICSQAAGFFDTYPPETLLRHLAAKTNPVTPSEEKLLKHALGKATLRRRVISDFYCPLMEAHLSTERSFLDTLQVSNFDLALDLAKTLTFAGDNEARRRRLLASLAGSDDDAALKIWTQLLRSNPALLAVEDLIKSVPQERRAKLAACPAAAKKLTQTARVRLSSSPDERTPEDGQAERRLMFGFRDLRLAAATLAVKSNGGEILEAIVQDLEHDPDVRLLASAGRLAEQSGFMQSEAFMPALKAAASKASSFGIDRLNAILYALAAATLPPEQPEMPLASPQGWSFEPRTLFPFAGSVLRNVLVSETDGLEPAASENRPAVRAPNLLEPQPGALPNSKQCRCKGHWTVINGSVRLELSEIPAKLLPHLVSGPRTTLEAPLFAAADGADGTVSCSSPGRARVSRTGSSHKNGRVLLITQPDMLLAIMAAEGGTATFFIQSQNTLETKLIAADAVIPALGDMPVETSVQLRAPACLFLRRSRETHGPSLSEAAALRLMKAVPWLVPLRAEDATRAAHLLRTTRSEGNCHD